MLEWSIRSIFTITVDNATCNDAALEYLKVRASHKKSAIVENEFMHVRCCAHILNLIVTEGLKELDESILKVKNAVKYVKSNLRSLRVVWKGKKLSSGVCCALML
jgi:hypothetical protein